VTQDDEQSENTEGLRQFDPVKQISTDSPRLAASWLRDGQNLTLLQRVGHGLISLAYIGAGAAATGGAKLNFQEGTIFMALLFSSIAIFFFFFGAKGLQNIFRTKHLRN
jgi:hypothetical protein